MSSTVIEPGQAAHLIVLPPKNFSVLLEDTKCYNSLHRIKQTHCQTIKYGLSQDNFVAGSLVKCYSNPNLSSLEDAQKVFDEIPQPHAFLWNSMIRGFLDNHAPHQAILCFSKMVAENSKPNKYTFPSVFKACTVGKAIKEGRQVHAHVVKQGFSGDGYVQSSGIQMYAVCGQVRDARRLFDEIEELDVICWNAMVDGYLKCGEVEAARGLFECMPSRNIGSWNALISGYAKFGMIDAARKLFDEMPQRDEITWSAIIDGYVHVSLFNEALAVFQEMQIGRIRPRKFVLSSVLAACANVGALDQGAWIHAYMEKNSIPLDAVLGTALVDMYSKCGRLDIAMQMFDKMPQKEVFSWNAMIGGLAMNGQANDAIRLFSEMREKKIKPDGITFVGVLNACAHGGMVQKGLEYFNLMKQDFEIKPTVEHYGCMVDLLGRAGLLVEAEDIIRSMPMKPNAAVWGALLGACRIHGNVDMGARAGEILLKLEPENSGRYALLSNIYARAGRWDDVSRVRKLMKERGIKTIPGRSSIDFDGVIHEFVMGDGSHPQMKEIQSMLGEIIERLRFEGYVPNTTDVLFDIDEEEKESALCHHSEKLAIAFGFLNTTPETTIRIVKNLRVCGDCHTATKLISRVYNREILVRDRVRYHRFKDGVCSCMDFW